MANEEYGNWKFEASDSGNNSKITSNQVEIKDYKNGVNIRVSMFFDGTNNNMYNVQARLAYERLKDGEVLTDPEEIKGAEIYEKRLEEGDSELGNDDSYDQSYSNVARLFRNYVLNENATPVKISAVYVDGVGTLQYEDDSMWGGGEGEYNEK